MNTLQRHKILLEQWERDKKNPNMRCKDCSHMIFYDDCYGCFIQGNGSRFVPRGRHEGICGFFLRRADK